MFIKSGDECHIVKFTDIHLCTYAPVASGHDYFLVISDLCHNARPLIFATTLCRMVIYSI